MFIWENNCIILCRFTQMDLKIQLIKSGHSIGVYIPRFKTEISWRLSDKLSVYSTELTAIIIGLQWVKQIKPNRIVICSDSSSALKSIKSTKTDREDLLVEMYTLLYRLKVEGIIVYFCWVPAHIGIVGNETADKLAKKSITEKLGGC